MAAADAKNLKRADSIMENQVSEEDHEIATTSIYTTPAVIVYIGLSRTVFTIQQAIVDQYPGLKKRLTSDASIVLDTIDEHIGHILIHFIYTGRYQPLKDGAERKAATEFKRSVLAYCAAKLCGIAKLEEFTKVKSEELQKDLSVFDLHSITEEVSAKLPQDDTWFSSGLQEWVKAKLLTDNALSSTAERLPDLIGRSTIFDRAIVKSLLEMCAEKSGDIQRPLVNGIHTTTEPEFINGSSKAASVADSGIHMQEPLQEQETVSTPEPISESVVESGEATPTETSPVENGIKASHPEKPLETGTTPKITTEVLPEHQVEILAETPVEEPLESNGRTENLTQTQSLPAATDSDGEAPVVKPAKKKKNKKKSQS